jgi:hypothetical protein
MPAVLRYKRSTVVYASGAEGRRTLTITMQRALYEQVEKCAQRWDVPVTQAGRRLLEAGLQNGCEEEARPAIRR